jgi:hypothetical protein
VLDLFEEQRDLVFGELKQAEDAVVDFGFGVGEFAGESFDLGALLGETGFPLVDGSRLGGRTSNLFTAAYVRLERGRSRD